MIRNTPRLLAMLAVVHLLSGCKGAITSTAPLLTPRDATYPFARAVEVAGQRLDDNAAWDKLETARLVRMGEAYRIIEPDQQAPSPDTFLFKQVSGDEFVVQGSNGTDVAYALIVHADRYYLFTFNHAGQSCLDLSQDELLRLHTRVAGDRCYVAGLRDLVGLLRYLRSKFPHPTSAFVVRQRQSP